MKLLVIGFDALDFLVYEKTGLDWEPKMLESLYLTSGPCWVTIYTGAPRQVHKVSQVVGMRNDGALAWRDMGLPCVWDVLGEKGYKVALCNLPITNPPKEVNGWMVSGYPLWEEPYGCGIEVPDWWFRMADINYEREIPSWGDGYGYGFVSNDEHYYREKSWDEIVHIGCQKQTYVLNWFVEHAKEADFGFVVSTWLDRLGHYKGIKEEDAPFLADLVDKTVYGLGDLDPENILLLSDHGFRGHRHQNEGVIAAMGLDVDGVEHIGQVAGLIAGAFGLEMPAYDTEFIPDPSPEVKKRLDGWGYMT